MGDVYLILGTTARPAERGGTTYSYIHATDDEGTTLVFADSELAREYMREHDLPTLAAARATALAAVRRAREADRQAGLPLEEDRYDALLREHLASSTYEVVEVPVRGVALATPGPESWKWGVAETRLLTFALDEGKAGFRTADLKTYMESDQKKSFSHSYVSRALSEAQRAGLVRSNTQVKGRAKFYQLTEYGLEQAQRLRMTQ